MTLVLGLISGVTIAAAVAAVALRNLVHCVLCLAVCLTGLAALYLRLNAQFIGFAQVLVYIGAVAVLILFGILLTGAGSEPQRTGERALVWSSGWTVGIAVAAVVLALLAGAVLSSGMLPAGSEAVPQASVRQLGDELMTRYVLPLQIAGLLLTAALIGAVVLAMRERGGGVGTQAAVDGGVGTHTPYLGAHGGRAGLSSARRGTDQAQPLGGVGTHTPYLGGREGDRKEP